MSMFYDAVPSVQVVLIRIFEGNIWCKCERFGVAFGCCLLKVVLVVPVECFLSLKRVHSLNK
jgi:hypothetical protein